MTRSVVLVLVLVACTTAYSTCYVGPSNCGTCVSVNLTNLTNQSTGRSCSWCVKSRKNGGSSCGYAIYSCSGEALFSQKDCDDYEAKGAMIWLIVLSVFGFCFCFCCVLPLVVGFRRRTDPDFCTFGFDPHTGKWRGRGSQNQSQQLEQPMPDTNPEHGPITRF